VHEIPSHVQAPPTQCCPGAHAAPPPQLQRPAEHASATSGSHAVQAPPAGPHVLVDTGSHASPSQQPDVHDDASHTQRPDAQRWPGRHAAWAPQVHVPAAEHASLTMGSHATQLAPAMPHAPSARRRQVAPSQQPDGHDVSSQTQRPSMHRCPATQAGPSPHAHAPFRSQPSLLVGEHRPHTLPAAAHAITDRGRQLEPEQHPPGHVVASHPEHAPPAHVSPAGQCAHARPALPHSVASRPDMHVVPSQQPDAHDVASHTQVPASQRCPAAHAGPPPQPDSQRDAAPSSFVQLHPGSTAHA
jgi:hypothetical protein